MKNQIVVVCYEGKNYFSIKSRRGLEFLVTFLRMRYFAGEERFEFYHIEGWRNKKSILYGYISCYTRDCLVATFDHSLISPIHTDRPDDEMREFEVLSADPFLDGDIIITAIQGGLSIANDLHLALEHEIAIEEPRMDNPKVSMVKQHADERLRYRKLRKRKILIPGLY